MQSMESRSIGWTHTFHSAPHKPLIMLEAHTWCAHWVPTSWGQTAQYVKEGHTSHCTGLMGEVNSPFGLFHIEICNKEQNVNSHE